MSPEARREQKICKASRRNNQIKFSWWRISINTSVCSKQTRKGTWWFGSFPPIPVVQTAEAGRLQWVSAIWKKEGFFLHMFVKVNCRFFIYEFSILSPINKLHVRIPCSKMSLLVTSLFLFLSRTFAHLDQLNQLFKCSVKCLLSATYPWNKVG